MFRPLDIPVFDIDWPMMDGRVYGLHDIRIVVKSGPAGFSIPSDIVITNAGPGTLTLAMADRATGTVVQSTYLTLTGLEGRGVSYDIGNDIMTVSVVTDGRPLSKTDGVLRVMPTCVMWVGPSKTPFNPVLPIPNEGWSREIDETGRVITYRADPIKPGVPTANKLMMINGLSTPDILITSDGAAYINGAGNTVTIEPVVDDGQ